MNDRFRSFVWLCQMAGSRLRLLQLKQMKPRGASRLFAVLMVFFILLLFCHPNSPDNELDIDLNTLSYETTEAPAIDMEALKARQRDKLAQLRREASLPQIPSPPRKLKRGIRNRLSYYFPYTEEIRESSYPGFIWQTWKFDQNDEQLSNEHSENVKDWTNMHPEYIHQIVKDDFALKLVKYLYQQVPEVIDTYETLSKPVMKADFFRYLILFARGGVYTDIDTRPLKPANGWVPESIPMDYQGMVIGIEADPDRPDWSEWYARRIQFVQWTMRAKPGHPILREVIARIVEEVRLRRSRDLSADIMEVTGPGVWTDSVFAYFNTPEVLKAVTGNPASKIKYERFFNLEQPVRIGDVVVLPITGFSPGQGHMGSKPITDETAMVQHYFDSSWKPEGEIIKP